MKGARQLKEFYKNEAPVYHKTRYDTLYGKVFQALHHELLHELLEKHTKRGALVLEVACGTGHTTELLCKSDRRLIACDLTRPMMEQARARTAAAVHLPVFVEANAKRLPFPDNHFDAIVSTRFLHLFRHSEQREILEEMLRVLKPGGLLLVDFDNWLSRWLYAIPYLIYNLIRYGRHAPYSIYNRVNLTTHMLSELGASVDDVFGVGGTHLVLAATFSPNIAIALGRLHRNAPLRGLAEQFLICGHK